MYMPFSYASCASPDRIHRAAAFLFGFQRLPGIAGVEHEEQLPGVNAFERRFEFQVGDAAREDCFHGLRGERVASARVAEVVRDQIEPRPCAAPCPAKKINTASSGCAG